MTKPINFQIDLRQYLHQELQSHLTPNFFPESITVLAVDREHLTITTRWQVWDDMKVGLLFPAEMKDHICKCLHKKAPGATGVLLPDSLNILTETPDYDTTYTYFELVFEVTVKDWAEYNAYWNEWEEAERVKEEKARVKRAEKARKRLEKAAADEAAELEVYQQLQEKLKKKGLI